LVLVVVPVVETAIQTALIVQLVPLQQQRVADMAALVVIVLEVLEVLAVEAVLIAIHMQIRVQALLVKVTQERQVMMRQTIKAVAVAEQVEPQQM
jgi:hypothetical protein